MNTLLRLALLCALLASVAGWMGVVSPTAAQSARYNDTMDSEADGLLSTVSPDPANINFAYQDGTFVMLAPNQASPKEILTDIKTPSMGGSQVLFDVAISGDVNLKYVVVGCRAGPGYSGYQLAVDLDTAEATLRSRDGQYSQVLGRTEALVALNTGATMNQIGIACEDTRISAIVNGVTVLTAFDSDYTDGYAYLGVGSRVGAIGGLTATFDNLTVADLGGAGFESAPEIDHAPIAGEPTQAFAAPPFDAEAAYVQSAITSVLTPATAGPIGGSVDLAPNSAASEPLGVQLEEFYADFTFITPQMASSGLWLYGFCFWADAAGNCTDFFIQSDGASVNWGLGSFPASGDYTLLDSGPVPAGAIDLTPGAENVIALVVYQGSAILAANGQIAASFHLTSKPVAGDLVERVEFSSDDPNAQPLTMSTQEFAVWDLSDVDLMVDFEEDIPAETTGEQDELSIMERVCRVTQPGGSSNGPCNEESLS